MFLREVVQLESVCSISLLDADEMLLKCIRGCRNRF